jgi:hypothetical protein
MPFFRNRCVIAAESLCDRLSLMALDPSSHLVLARKWRPDRFAELVGQEHVTRTLGQALQSGRIAHAFLFTGLRVSWPAASTAKKGRPPTRAANARPVSRFARVARSTWLKSTAPPTAKSTTPAQLSKT